MSGLNAGLKLRRDGDWVYQTPPLGAYMNGLNAAIIHATNAALNPSGAITLETWYYPVSLVGEHDLIARYGSGGEQFVLFHHGDVPGFSIRTSAGWFERKAATGTIAANTWVHLAGVYDGSNITIYINGISDGAKATSGSWASATEPIYFGTSNNNKWTNGVMTDMRYWKANRSAALGVKIDGSESGLVIAYDRVKAGTLGTWPTLGSSGLNGTMKGASREPMTPPGYL